MTIRVRALSPEETGQLAELARSRKRGAGLVRRAQIVLHAVEEQLSAPEIAARMGLCGETVRFWLKRLHERGFGWGGGGHALGASADLHRRGAQRGYRRGAVTARRVGPAVRVVAAGPLGGLFGRGGYRHEAQPGERGPARRGAEVAPRRDLVRRAGGPAV